MQRLILQPTGSCREKNDDVKSTQQMILVLLSMLGLAAGCADHSVPQAGASPPGGYLDR